ncbi:MAG TPA: mononuclear molybdenum enzyme YedY, partial [Gammaproteobacteria bacterium]|nr:mononuclear molybdenum enzyme YedY [Gammaproteobacteria bacterium]
MLIKRPEPIKPSEITPESAFRQRRELLKVAVALGLVPTALTSSGPAAAAALPGDGRFADVARWPGSATEEPTPYEYVSQYNNYYEFGTGKDDPARNAHTLVTDPWSVVVEGEAENTGTFTLEDVLAPHALEERVYRFRC